MTLVCGGNFGVILASAINAALTIRASRLAEESIGRVREVVIQQEPLLPVADGTAIAATETGPSQLARPEHVRRNELRKRH